jgi:restriction system protein
MPWKVLLRLEIKMKGFGIIIATIVAGFYILAGLYAFFSGFAKTKTETVKGLSGNAGVTHKTPKIKTFTIKDRLHQFLERRYGRTEIAADMSIDPLIKREPQPITLLRSEIAKQEGYSLAETPPAVSSYSKFISSRDRFFPSVSESPVRNVDTEILDEILRETPDVDYREFISSMEKPPTFPHKVPVKVNCDPPQAPVIPAFAPDEPSLTLPYWAGRKARFNKYVDAAHSKEILRFEKAKRDRLALLKEYKRLKADLKQLVEKNQSAWKLWDNRINGRHRIQVSRFESAKSHFDAAVNRDVKEAQTVQSTISEPGIEGLKHRIRYSLQGSQIPFLPFDQLKVDYDEANEIMVCELPFPDLESLEWTKMVELKSGLKVKPANLKEKKLASDRLHPALCLRLLKEIYKCDTADIIKGIGLNGIVEFTSKTTGHTEKCCAISVFATKEQVLNLKLSRLDPEEAFSSLAGRRTPSYEVVAVQPVMTFNPDESRFVPGKEVIDHLNDCQNLAAMDWEDFEHLCRELFAREFSESGADVRVTRASRDQGIDAVIYHPDPIKGGKIVVQAKRYTNTVDVSAVRDLYGTVLDEGAMKGILVTTSSFGRDSYDWAKDKPLTLIKGSELLGLLEKNGRKFRIDLPEAKKILAEEPRSKRPSA